MEKTLGHQSYLLHVVLDETACKLPTSYLTTVQAKAGSWIHQLSSLTRAHIIHQPSSIMWHSPAKIIGL